MANEVEAGTVSDCKLRVNLKLLKIQKTETYAAMHPKRPKEDIIQYHATPATAKPVRTALDCECTWLTSSTSIAGPTH